MESLKQPLTHIRWVHAASRRSVHSQVPAMVAFLLAGSRFDTASDAPIVARLPHVCRFVCIPLPARAQTKKCPCQPPAPLSKSPIQQDILFLRGLQRVAPVENSLRDHHISRVPGSIMPGHPPAPAGAAPERNRVRPIQVWWGNIGPHTNTEADDRARVLLLLPPASRCCGDDGRFVGDSQSKTRHRNASVTVRNESVHRVCALRTICK